MIQSGHDAVPRYLSEFESAIPGKSAQYILLCDLRCYANRYVQNYSSAIDWVRRGDLLKRRTEVDTRYSTNHNLSLALRDSGQIDEVLAGFLGDVLLEDVLAESGAADKEAHFFGNLGRCLYLAGRRKGRADLLREVCCVA